jgi:uncharacterized protein YjbI with pentapeptide repeats
MGKKRSWWQVNKRFIITLVTIAFLIVLIKLILIGYGYDWTGFNGKDKSGKTLYDWLQLLIVPVVLAIGGYLFSLTLNRNERKAADKHNQTEREIAQDNQREAALQEYIDKMSELLLEKHLRESQPEDEVRNIARVRTLTVLPRLDGDRKRSVLQFLYESGLINKDNSIIDLEGADLTEVNLSYVIISRINLSNSKMEEAQIIYADLSDANLTGTNLSKADLYHTILRKSNLSGAVLSDTDMTSVNLKEVTGTTPVQLNLAKSLYGATMPDGTIHPFSEKQIDLDD